MIMVPQLQTNSRSIYLHEPIIMITELLQLSYREAQEGGQVYGAHTVALLALCFLWILPSVKKSKRSSASDEDEAPINGPPSFVTSPLQRKLSSSSLKEQELQKAEEALKEVLPNSSAAERRRFLLARNSDRTAAAKQLAGYLEWRATYDTIEKEHFSETDSVETDTDDWNRAFEISRKACQDDESSSTAPRLARMYHNDDGSPVCDKDGYRIIHLLPAQLDPKLASPATYALAMALYLDRKLDRTSTELYTVMLDVRGGKTWANVHPYKQLPFIQNVTKLLLSMFPERLYQCLLYPLPPACSWIWNLAAGFIDPLTVSKIRVLCGPAKIASPPPMEALQESVTKHVIAVLESERQATFVVDNNGKKSESHYDVEF